MRSPVDEIVIPDGVDIPSLDVYAACTKKCVDAHGAQFNEFKDALHKLSYLAQGRPRVVFPANDSSKLRVLTDRLKASKESKPTLLASPPSAPVSSAASATVFSARLPTKVKFAPPKRGAVPPRTIE